MLANTEPRYSCGDEACRHYFWIQKNAIGGCYNFRKWWKMLQPFPHRVSID